MTRWGRALREWLRVLRVAAYGAQGGHCYYCGRPMWERLLESRAAAQLRLAQSGRAVTRRELSSLRCTAEHLKRIADGGRSTVENVVAACHSCNGSRGTTDPALWRAARSGLGGSLAGGVSKTAFSGWRPDVATAQRPNSIDPS